jgi:hypothetical protein
MSRIYSTHKVRNAYEILVWKLERKRPLVDVGADRMIILKLIFMM